MQESDERLVHRYARGDVGAFERLLDRHRPAVFRFLLRLVGEGPRAEDLCQECWMRVVQAAPRWEERATFRTWLFTVARNLAADDARRARHRATVPLDAARPGSGDRTIADGVPAETRAPDLQADDALLRPRLEAAIAALPPEQREVFLLREFEGVPFAEIAEITRAPVPTVKSRMRYALEALRRALGEAGVAGDGLAGSGTP